MALIFQHNLKTFSGANLVKRANLLPIYPGFQAASTLAAAGAPGAAAAQPMLAAGFTEVLSLTPPTKLALLALAAPLFTPPAALNLLIVEVGITSVGRQREYIGLAWNPAQFAVTHAGMTARSAMNRNTIMPYTTTGPALAGAIGNQQLTIPAAALNRQADYRGIAYLLGTAGGVQHMIGFVHNTLTIGDPTGMVPSLGHSVDAVLNSTGGAYPAGTSAILGGDWNVSPRVRRTARRSRGPVQLYRAAHAVGGVRQSTTKRKVYDYWFTNNANVTDANCYLNTAVRGAAPPAAFVPGFSDHGCVIVSV